MSAFAMAHAALQVRSGADGSLSWSKCLMPVVDSQNHEPAPLSSAAAADVAALGLGWLAEPPHAGPATRVEFAAGGARWVATRRVPAGCPVTWRCVECSFSSLYVQT
jgi:hypothetical protein